MGLSAADVSSCPIEWDGCLGRWEGSTKQGQLRLQLKDTGGAPGSDVERGSGLDGDPVPVLSTGNTYMIAAPELDPKEEKFVG